MASKLELNRKLEKLQSDQAKIWIALRASRAAHEATLKKLRGAQKKLARRRWPWWRRLWVKIRLWRQ